MREAEAAAAAQLAAKLQRQQEAEISAMGVEDDLSRQLVEAQRAAALVLAQREAFLRELYTPLMPMYLPDGVDVGDDTTTEVTESLVAGVDGRLSDLLTTGLTTNGHGNTNNSGENQTGNGARPISAVKTEVEEDGENRGRRAPWWWKGADAPLIWSGPARTCSRALKTMPGSRFVPYAQALLDDLETQPASIGGLSREFLNLLGLPYVTVRDMHKQAGIPVWFQRNLVSRGGYHGWAIHAPSESLPMHGYPRIAVTTMWEQDCDRV